MLQMLTKLYVTSFHLKTLIIHFKMIQNDANNAITPPGCVTSISSSRASKGIVHPSHKTSSLSSSSTVDIILKKNFCHRS